MSSRRRSVLYLPGSSEKMMRKAGARGADVLVLDLEDGVHPDVKSDARARIEEALPSYDWGGSEVFVRANGLSTPWAEDDLAMARRVRPAGVVLPKCEDPTEVSRVAAGFAPAVPLYLMIETATGVLRAGELAAIDNVAGLLFGAADFRESIHASALPDESEILLARSTVVLAARASGREAFDTPWFEYQDTAGLEASALRARRLGFDGKTAIHPVQLDAIHRAFTPSEDEVERARKILRVIEEAAASAQNVATLDGEMVEALHVEGARRTLRQAGESA